MGYGGKEENGLEPGNGGSRRWWGKGEVWVVHGSEEEAEVSGRFQRLGFAVDGPDSGGAAARLSWKLRRAWAWK
eukprot:92763-Rhodomonas_salina.1